MSYIVIVVVIFVGLVSILALGAFRPARVTSRREIVGRPRRRLGTALVAVGLIALVGGQVYAVVSGPGRVLAEDGATVRLLHPKAGGGNPDLYLIRVLTLSDLVLDEPRLLEHGAALVTLGTSVEFTAESVGRITPAEFDFRLDRDPGGRHGLSIGARVSDRTTNLSLGSSGTLDTDGRLTDTLDLGPRDAASSPTATFPGSVFPGSILPHTILLVDPAPAGVEEVYLHHVMDSPAGDRILAACTDPAHDVVRTGRSNVRGIARIFQSMGIYAWILLAVTGTGCAFLTARPGVGLGLFLLLAPLLLTALDGIALSSQHSALGHEDPRVRASAIAGLQSSTLFGRSGPKALEAVEETDPAAVERTRRLIFRDPNVRYERKVLGFSGKRTLEGPSGE
jgi:hypothetical protein